MGNQRAGSRIYAGVIAAGIKRQHVYVTGEKRMVDGIGPIAIEAVNPLDVQMHRHVGVEALYVIVQSIRVFCQRLAAESNPLLEHRVIERQSIHRAA